MAERVNFLSFLTSTTIITTINETVSQLLPPYAAHEYTMLIPKALVVCSATLAIVGAQSGSDYTEASTASISFLEESPAPSARWVLMQGGEIGGETASATPVKGPGGCTVHPQPPAFTSNDEYTGLHLSEEHQVSPRFLLSILQNEHIPHANPIDAL